MHRRTCSTILAAARMSGVPPLRSLPLAPATAARKSSGVLKAGILYSAMSCLAGTRLRISDTGDTARVVEEGAARCHDEGQR